MSDGRREIHANEQRSRRSRYHEAAEVDNATMRVLAPFLARHKKKQRLRLTEVKEEYQHVYQQATRQSEVIAKLAAYFSDSLELPTALNETSEILRNFTNSNGVSLYMVDPSNEFIVLHPKFLPGSDRHIVRYPIQPGRTVAAYVAYIQEFIVTDDVADDLRFPEGIPGTEKDVKAVLCLPVLTYSEGDVLAVIELYRTVHEGPYTLDEIKTAIAMTTWMGAAIHQNNEKLFALKQTELTKYLMHLLQLLFSGVIPFDKFVSDTVAFAKATVGAERGLFYRMVGSVEVGTEEDIFTEVYEDGIDASHQCYKKKTVQRLSTNAPGLAGYVARSGLPIVVEDAYQDERFNRASDILGFRSRTIIAVPVKSSLHVVGVLQLVNKFPSFTEKDEEVLRTFASFSLLACQFEKASDDLRKTLHRYEGDKELLLIHIRPCPDDLELLASSAVLKTSEMPRGYFGFDWFLGKWEEFSPQYVVFSMCHCLGSDYFDYTSLSEFVLMTKKSYRPNPYHNFVHAFTVFHCTFNIINKNPHKFTTLEKAALLIATLCHDADHFGVTNSFLGITGNWLASLYEESTLEHHHFDICMMLIELTDLLSKLTKEEFAETKNLIESLILATDLMAHFKIRGSMSSTIKSGSFDWSNREHRLMYMHVIMTCCDMSGQCKPFSTAKYVTECLYAEFYCQGDEEKKHGVTPLAMMDRRQTDLIPRDQIQFLTIICIPCLELLVSVLPNTEKLLKMCLNVRESWKIIKEKQDRNLWCPEEAFAAYKPGENAFVRSEAQGGRRKHRTGPLTFII